MRNITLQTINGQFPQRNPYQYQHFNFIIFHFNEHLRFRFECCKVQSVINILNEKKTYQEHKIQENAYFESKK